MRKVLFLIFAGLLAASMTQVVAAEDYDEKGSMLEEVESESEQAPEVSKEDMQAVMEKFITTKAAEKDGVFELEDRQTGKVRRLSYMDLHEGIGVKDGQHFSCADFKDLDSGEVLDVDIYVDVVSEGLEVTNAVIHKVDGDPVMKESGTEKKGS